MCACMRGCACVCVCVRAFVCVAFNTTEAVSLFFETDFLECLDG